ncbi:MAG: HAMP domain-containing histidine kinase [Ignavibacteria bacterium]|nr:HAMP domain-containing histidine kinase [Ignavibacteria bacterium]
MKISTITSALNLKLILIIIGSAIALGTLFYTQSIVSKLQEREKEIVQLYASSLEFVASSENITNDFTFIFQNIIQRIDFPLILTDAQNKLTSIVPGKGFKNIDIGTEKDPKKIELMLNEKLTELSEQHEPIVVKSPDGIVIQKIFYGDSDIIYQLRFYPYLQIIFAIVFIIIAYLSFNYIRKNEQSNIWVGMSKETAHQLGTPISSLMGWAEMLKMNFKNPDKVINTADEITNDLIRLNKITTRFSKIGSKPELIDESPYNVINRVINYFERRLPQLGKNVALTIEGDESSKAKLNVELFEWVIENLIKNSLDAIEHKQGKIKFLISRTNNNIEIEITDNGKGIDYKNWKDIFRPGFSTKRRGWGLGLSLSKRIIADYHQGKIFVNNSVIDEGTTIKVVLKAV